MEPISLVVVHANDRGVITGVGGTVGTFGIGEDAVGRAWTEVFAGWQLENPFEGKDSSVRLHATSPSGEPVTVDCCPLPGGGGRVALFRPAEAVALTFQQQQLCGLGELSAGVAHEINNALTLLQGWLDLLVADLAPDDPKRATFELLVSEAGRIGRLTRNLLQVARGADEEPSELDLRLLLEEVLGLVSYEMRNHNIEVESRLAADLPAVKGSAGRLKQALLNLLVNARQAMPRGGRLTVSAAKDSDGRVRIEVADTGCGIPEEMQSRVFSPFFTTKRDGTGLGLPVMRRIIEDHGGAVELESRPGAGTRFILRLPAGTG